ncbi:MAG: amidohydrolase family protein [Spirochaetales bacterium]|nr:amidohydrolase family protein [Spirochaetales bacterium]
MDVAQQIERAASSKRQALETLGLFDANLWLGRPAFFPLAKAVSAEELGALLRRYALIGALVSHWDAVHLSAQDGNQALLAAESALPEGVFTIWTGLPTALEEPGPLPGIAPPHPRMRGVRLFPQTHHFSLAPWVVGGLCEWCVEHRLPLFVWHVEIRWDDLHALAEAFPKLALVVETQWQKILYHLRDLAGLLASRPNVYVETSNLIGQDHLAQFVKSVGAERLVFGSFLPVNDPYAAVGVILDADISESDKQAIAGGNLRRLVGEVRA